MTDKLPVVRTEKRLMQKIAKVISYLFTITAIVCAILLFAVVDPEDMVMKSSIGAAAFFFFTAGLVLHTIGTSDLPNLKIEDKE